ncbi:3-oxoacyl-(acyl-carrier-protein) synthase [Catenulispora sp. EB89]|uniref:beta-ketoacyl synthase N-terminal-like domain-containing protein n=1 Tax=Catenulispora sp. EB89 TaxID=3156257 RepID=UPI00351611E4
MKIQGIEDDDPAADHESAVALVGMSGRFPGASTVAQLWDDLTRGRLGLRAITDEEAVAAGLDPAVTADPGYVRVGGPVDGIELFDAAVFGFTEREAEIMEPQHRLLLECAWEALESAGYRPTEPDGVVGIYAGCSFPDYMLRNLRLAKDPEAAKSFAAGNERDSLTSLVSYKLGLRGPGVTVQSFCSTSLVAVHLACQSLLTYETDIALAGGASLPLPQPAGYVHRPDGIHSPDGRIRPFDAEANGTVPGSGVAVVALKRMADALADGDVIHAVILGSAVNNDGRDRAGYGAPGVDGEAEAISAALAVAGVKPESVGYVECHAIGTPLGDSIELAALGRVFKDSDGTRVLGSVKPAVGHLDAASGVTALIRAALCLRHALLPAVPGFRTPNPALAASEGRFTVLTRDQPWPAGPEPRRAGVSSFGVGGTNAHVVLEEAPVRESGAARATGPQLLAFSAADEEALGQVAERLRGHLRRVMEGSEGSEESQSLADIAFTLQVSRGRFALRRAVVCRDLGDAIEAMGDPARWIEGLTQRRDPQVRIVVPEELTGAVWAELGAAIAGLVSQDVAVGRVAVLEALRVALDGLGVRATIGDNQGSTNTVELAVDPAAGGAAEWLVAALGRLWLAGSRIDWKALHRGAGRRVELPTYPFQRKRHWIDADASASLDTKTVSDFEPRVRSYVPIWRPLPRPTADLDTRLRAAGPWLLLGADSVMSPLEHRLLIAGAEVIESEADLRDLIVAPRICVVHESGIESAPTFVDALREALPTARVGLVFLTSQAVGVSGADLAHPEQAPIGAFAGQVGGRHIDIDGFADVDQTLAAMVGEYQGPTAVRGADVWVRDYELVELDGPGQQRRSGSFREQIVGIAGVEGTAVQAAKASLEAAGAKVIVISADDGDAGDCRLIALCPDSPDGAALAARAHAARQRGHGRWLALTWDESIAGDDHQQQQSALSVALRFLEGAVAASSHLAQVVITNGSPQRGFRSHVASTADADPDATRAERTARPTLAVPYIEPDAGLERSIADAWIRTLNVEPIGADDNFFELGGRSLTAVQLAVSIGSEQAVTLPATAIVEHPTVRGLASCIRDT